MTEQTGGRTALLVIAWLWVLIPFGYGLYQLIRSITQLFS
ncbi:MFS transporter small subunit [Labedaea rhizosphaerae]|uniref:Uncharacterized protein n=1 Tax=Labedaea rhizosphaerae TaxID=598644 RepID=A0A4R6S987_LABRH|nr:hypothetical protein EV186_104346 [Labedaea rhizosphaerae]